MKDKYSREHALNELAKAYMAVRDGKAGCVMVVVQDDGLEVQTCNVNPAEAMRIAVKAADILTDEVYIKLVEIKERT